MQEDKRKLMNDAMLGGIFLGLYWVVKYFCITVFKIAGLNLLLGMGTLFLLYYFLVRYKNIQPNNSFTYWHGVQFGILLFLFASFFEATAVFIHISWMEPQFLGAFYAELINALKQLNVSPDLVQVLQAQPTPSPANFIISNVILADVFRGLVSSLIFVPLALKNNGAKL